MTAIGQNILSKQSESVASMHSGKNSRESKKQKGQFFTPTHISEFMASFVELPKDVEVLHVLDPGCGVLSLTSTLVEYLSSKYKSLTKITIDAYDIDLTLYESNKSTILAIKNFGKKVNIDIKVNCIYEDYLTIFSNFISDESVLQKYDVVIMNPPYFKMSKKDNLKINTDLLGKHSNIYGAFIFAACLQLKEGGQMICISPRSFLSGLYFQKFRDSILKENSFSHLHLFTSRSKGFKKDKVLQENIIFRLSKTKKEKRNSILVSASNGEGNFKEPSFIHNLSEDFLIRQYGKMKVILLPKSIQEIESIKKVNSWKSTFSEQGLKCSTGPVVPFRSKSKLKFKKSFSTVPLLWIQNCSRMSIRWPLDSCDKPQWISKNTINSSRTIPLNNYVLVRRFSPNTEDCKVIAAPLYKSDFCFDEIGIENHLNFIFHENRLLSSNEVDNIAGFMNSEVLNNFFLALSGNTQVGATELNNMPFPVDFFTQK